MIALKELQQKQEILKSSILAGRAPADHHHVWCVTYEGTIISVVTKDINTTSSMNKYCVMVDDTMMQALSPSHFFWRRADAVTSLQSGGRKKKEK